MGDTIAAIATAPGKAGVAVVRVSGPDAFSIAEKLTRKKCDRACCRTLAVFPPAAGSGQCAGETASVRQQDLETTSVRQQEIDRAVVLTFVSPHSYTGEDVVEFQCHGGSVTPRRILEACFAAGARLARRGEFTERAFLNGKMDLSEAESVIDLIDAKTDAAADDALAHLGGELKRRYRELYDLAVSLSSELEHSLDVDESDLTEEFTTRINSKLSTLNSKLLEAISSAKRTQRLRDGALVVLAGPPNAGKSSLLNALLGENRAIVSDIPGTTRDSIEAWIDLGGIPVRLVDTAGLRGTSDAIESEGVRRAEELISQADVVLQLSDSGDFSPLANANVINVSTKSDLNPSQPSQPSLRVSSKTGEGLDSLRELLIEKLSNLEPRQSSRGLDLLTAAYNKISSIRNSSFFILHSSFSPDPVLLANAIRAASESLGKLIGATYSDDLLDALFSRFCVGK